MFVRPLAAILESTVDAASVAKLFDRAAHFSKVATAFGGSGCSWSYTFADGETHRYVLNRIKSPEQIEHEILTLAIWLWSLKDHLKGRSQTLGRNPQEVEAYASADPYLPLCADLANTAKHGKLTSSRSGRWPRLGRLHYEIPQEVMRRITFRAFEVETDIAHPELVTLELPILDSAGEQIAEARRRALAGDYAGILRPDCFRGVRRKTRDALPGTAPRCAGRRAFGKA